MKYFKVSIVLMLTVIVFGDDFNKMVALNLGIDYSSLAYDVEMNKHNILNFLNQTVVKCKYKELYDNLLLKLTDSARRIVAGQNTSITALPWQVSLREKTYPICGGSILTDVWLITAAHCLLRVKASELNVRLGSSWKTYGGEMYDVKECFVHPRYISKTKANDVGLVRLYTSLRFSARVLPIQVVSREERLLANERVIVSGWGKLKEGGASATYLQSSIVKTIAMKSCRSSGLSHKAIDPGAMFCAGSFTQNSPDACQGDSGGPIVNDGILIGIVSWGLGCARGNFPGVYTRLAHPIIWDWVRNHITSVKEINKTSGIN